MARAPLLQLTDISLTFGGDPVFDGLSLAVQQGDRVALVGRNGSGKSTLMKVMAGLVEPDRGIRAVPLLNVSATFPAPSRLGDMLDFTLGVSRLGTKSFSVKIKAHCGGQARLISDQSSAWTRRDGGTLKAEAIPPEVRTRMEQFLENS